jgi:hypothetical protein
MLIREIILNEDSTESNDIIILAEFLGNNLSKFIDKFPNRDKFTIEIVSKGLHIPIPYVKSPNLKNLLTHKIQFVLISSDISDGSFITYRGLYNSNKPGYITINIKIIPDTINLIRTLAHEMQHALDNNNSRGKAITKSTITGNQPIELKSYLKDQHELNARYTEVLYALVKINPPKEELEFFINKLFRLVQLTTDLWEPNDKTASKKINHLKNRAYKFYDEIMTMPRPTVNELNAKQTWTNKIKQLIKSTIAKLNHSG